VGAGHDDRCLADRAAGFPAWPAMVIQLRSGEAGSESWTYMAGAPHMTPALSRPPGSVSGSVVRHSDHLFI
jgi:hypothetical protein